MALTSEQIAAIISKYVAADDATSGLNGDEIEQVSDAMDSGLGALSGRGTDTTDGTPYILILKPTKI